MEGWSKDDEGDAEKGLAEDGKLHLSSGLSPPSVLLAMQSQHSNSSLRKLWQRLFRAPVQPASIRDQLLLHRALTVEALFHLPCPQAHWLPFASIMASSEADFTWGLSSVAHWWITGIRVGLAGVLMSIILLGGGVQAKLVQEPTDEL